MSKVGGIFKFGYGVLDNLGMFSPTEKAIDLLGQDKFPARDLLRLEDDGKTKGLLSKFGKSVSDEMVFTGLEDKILGLPDSGSITSKELKDYLAGNKTRVEEIIKSDKNASDAGQMAMDNFEDFVPTTINDIRRNIDGVEGEVAGSKQTEGFISQFSSGDDYSVRLLDDIANDEKRIGSINNPYISKVTLDEFTDIFQGSIRNRYDEIAEKADQQLLDNNNFANKEEFRNAVYDVNTKNLIKFRFIDDSLYGDETAYTIRGNDNIGFQIASGKNLKKDAIDNDELIGQADSFNEALLQLNGYRRVKVERNTIDSTDLRPMHRNYTLPGGDNYQEILLKMEKPIDNVEANIGNIDEVLQEDRYGGSISLNAISGSPSDVTLDKGMVKNLKAGNTVTIDTSRGQRVLRVNKDTNKVELLKRDYTNEIHTGDEENVVVFTRTKDRVDEEGRKILYAEEIQSDMSQQGRSEGLVMGQKEKKSFINKNNPIIFGNILDSIDKLKKLTNIAELKGVKSSNIEINRRPISRQIVGFNNDTDVTFLTKRPDIQDIDFNKAHTFEDIVKKYQTKYKFITTKDNQIKVLSNQGIDKSNVNLLDKNTIEDQGIIIPKGIYEDVSDFVDMSLFKQRTSAFKKSLFNKILTKELKDNDFNQGKFGNVIDKFLSRDTSNYRDVEEFYKTNEIRNKMVEKLLTKDGLKKFINEKTKDAIMSEWQTLTSKPLSNFSQTIDDFNRLKPDDIIKFTSKRDINTRRKDVDGFHQTNIVTELTKAEFLEKIVEPKLISDKNALLKEATNYKAGEFEKAKNFDYPEDKIDEVYEGLKELTTNLEQAIKYDTTLQPKSDIPSAPFIGTSERFTELAIKRLMKYANDNNYDGVSFSSGLIHDKRWRQPQLKQYYDVIIPKVAKNLLKGTDATLEYKTILTDKNFLEQGINGELALDMSKYDINNQLITGDGMPNGGYITNTPTIYLTPKVKEYINSGTSLYTPIVATGLAGAITANQLMGSEEDIITEDSGI